MNIELNKAIISIILLIMFINYSFQLYTDLPKSDQFAENINHDGKLIWQKYNCNSCHQIYGLGGYLGPDLTNEYSKRSVNFISSFIKNGNETMPAYNLTEEETHLLIQFFQSMDETGSSDPRTYKINLNGSIEK